MKHATRKEIRCLNKSLDLFLELGYGTCITKTIVHTMFYPVMINELEDYCKIVNIKLKKLKPWVKLRIKSIIKAKWPIGLAVKIRM